MRTSIILILTIGLTATLTSCQSGWPSPGSFPQSSYSQYQPYRPSAPSSPSSLSIPSPGQYQSPALATLSQLPSYNRPALPSPSTPWSQNPSSGNRGWSIPAPSSSFSSIPQPPSAGFSSYPRPALTASAPQPAQVQGPPFQSSWTIQHQAGAGAPAAQPASRPFSLPSPQPQSYNIPSPPVQSWSPPPAPAQTWRAPAPASATQWSPPASTPVRQWSPPASAPVRQWSPPASAPVRQWSPPASAPVSQWSPPAAPAQTWSSPQPAPVQAAPQSLSSYVSPQNSQNLRPAPVHYASIGEQLQGDYKFGYHTGDGGSFREETRLPDGTVQGAYGFVDADGKQRIVRYKAGKDGFQAEGDDVPKGTPVASDGTAGQSAPQPAPSAPIPFEEGAAFRSFSQG